jgi:hypothetical protein
VRLCPLRLILNRLSGFCRVLGLRRGELAHGHSLLHDDLVFAAVLVPKIGHFIPELRYECAIVRVYPFVLPSIYPSSTPCVQVDVHAPRVFLIVLQATASHPFSDSTLGNPEPASSLLDGYTVYPSSIPFVHDPILDYSGRCRKPLEAILVALRRACQAIGALLHPSGLVLLAHEPRRST